MQMAEVSLPHWDHCGKGQLRKFTHWTFLYSPWWLINHGHIRILGCDFLTKHNLIIDFSQGMAYCPISPKVQLRLQSVRTNHSTCSKLTFDDELPQAIPTTIKDAGDELFDLPADVHPDLSQVIEDHKLLFSQQLSKTTVTTHVIDTGDATPMKVPSHSIPFHFAERVQSQLWNGTGWNYQTKQQSLVCTCSIRSQK